jgi:glycine dehydrogenase
MTEHRATLTELEMHGDFIRRHIGPSDHDIEAMLAELGCSSVDDLINQVVPANIVSERALELDAPRSERAASTYLRHMRHRNQVFVSMIGCGYHGTVMPPVIRRNVFENPDWYTAYTPYQAEVSQGRLEVLLSFQQMICDLTGMELANASLLDEATAGAEAMSMCRRLSKAKSNVFFVDERVHPQTLAVIKTRAGFMGFEILVGDPDKELKRRECFGILLQYPASTGGLHDLSGAISLAHEKQALAVVAADILSLTLVKPPGEMGADIVIGNSQRFGVPMGYGGPHAAFFATRDAHKRSIPGRIIGVSKDAQGRSALRMALQTREQHIRREKATSNICTAQVLLANISTLYAMYHGPEGLQTIANRVHRLTCILAEGLTQIGYEIVDPCFFDTIAVRVPGLAGKLAARARESRINLRVIDADHLGISLDETTKRENVLTLWKVFDTNAHHRLDIEGLDAEVKSAIPPDLVRSSPYLEHEIFHRYRSETEMMRYMRRTASKDVSLGRSMIPLGSCTMKLNATSELQPISIRDFANLHPFAPLEQTQGYQQLFEELEDMLCEITGFHAISLQPNAGSQGEYAGLLCIRAFHEANGQGHRDVCLIPSSAHGTNPASAVMAGMRVVIVTCDEDGNVDLNDLRDKAATHQEELAALMITYPSTHGVFEERVRDICQIVHHHGGQVYMDGANLNALVGICRPAEIGADVAHINLHKTFAIPHGGGGPGMGPIGVLSHLAPYLPNHVLVEGVNPSSGGRATIGQVSAAPWGSASILPISWAYIALLGASGLRRATEIAILNANYVAKRLNDHYPVVYTGNNGLVAHECIVDLSAIRESCGITVEDVAKRLMDYGFHAPTMSWPVADSFMIEPTESESRGELDRFCDALISIRQEIAEIEAGEQDAENNLLKNAPHSLHLLTQGGWDRSYPLEAAFFPSAATRRDKYWPPVGRVDNVQGDKTLVCSCPPIDYYEEEVQTP